jgi:hypothetical protein
MRRLSPQQKRAAEIAGIAGLLLLVVMLARRQSAANAAAGTGNVDPTTGAAIPGSSGAPADFSGEDSGNLSDIANGLAGSLGDIGTGLTTIGSNEQEISGGQQTILDTLGTLSGGLAATQSSIDALGANLQTSFAPATAGTPGPAAGAGSSAAAKRKVAAAAQTKTVIKWSPKLKREEVYHVTAGKKPVAVRAASHQPAPHRTPSRKPAPRRPAAKPKPKKRGRR